MGRLNPSATFSGNFYPRSAQCGLKCSECFHLRIWFWLSPWFPGDGGAAFNRAALQRLFLFMWSTQKLRWINSLPVRTCCSEVQISLVFKTAETEWVHSQQPQNLIQFQESWVKKLLRHSQLYTSIKYVYVRSRPKRYRTFSNLAHFVVRLPGIWTVIGVNSLWNSPSESRAGKFQPLRDNNYSPTLPQSWRWRWLAQTPEPAAFTLPRVI